MAVNKPVTTRDFVKVEAPKREGYTVVVSPFGVETTVPDEIRQVLFDSGYKEK